MLSQQGDIGTTRTTPRQQGLGLQGGAGTPGDAHVPTTSRRRDGQHVSSSSVDPEGSLPDEHGTSVWPTCKLGSL